MIGKRSRVEVFSGPAEVGRYVQPSLSGVLILAATLAVAAKQSPIVTPGVGASQPATRDRTAAAVAGSGRIHGRVVRADTSAPLRGAQITLSGDAMFARRAATDEDGRYEFAEVPAGRFVLSAAHGGYVTLEYGQRRAFEAGRPVTLNEAQVLNQIDFALPRGGVITGRITDEYGEPVTGAQIRVERFQYGPGGQRRLTTFTLGQAINPFALTTNDLGEFRVFGLTPGEYIVSARPGLSLVQEATADAPEGLLPTYYPGTVNVAQAQTVSVGLSEEVPAHFAMMPGRNVRISGTIVDSKGRPASGVKLTLLTITATMAGIGGGGSTAADGSFSIGNVPPGDYFLQARPQVGPEDETAIVPISVGAENISGLRITTTTGTTINGRVEWNSEAPRPINLYEARLRIRATPADGRPALLGAGRQPDADEDGTVQDDDTFKLRRIEGGVTLGAFGLPAEWTLKAVLVDGVDITDAGADASTLSGGKQIRVLMTDKLTDVSGSVRNGRGQSVSDYVVVVLPQQVMTGAAGTRFTTSRRPDQNGSFRIRALPPGRYVAAAVEALEQGREWDPQIPGTTNVAEAQTVAVNMGQEAAVQFGLASGRMSRFSGTVVDSTGRPAAGASLMLTTMAGGVMTGTGAGTVAPDGSFRIGNISPGEHSIEVRLEQTRPLGSTISEFANVPISAFGDEVTGLLIATSTGAVVSGRVEWEGTASRTGVSVTNPLRITTSYADGRRAILGATTSFDAAVNGTVNADNTFRLAGSTGRVLIAPTGVPPQWMLKAVMLDGVDITNVGIDAARFAGESRLRVVLTDKVTEISGSVANARGQAVADYVVVVLPAERVELHVAARYTRAARPDRSGAFRVRALPAGQYVVGAVEGLEPGNEWDPVFQSMVRDSGRRVTLTEGQALRVNLNLQ